MHWHLTLWYWDDTLEEIHHALYVALCEQEGRDDQSASPPVLSEAEQFAGPEDEATLPETGDFHRLTPAGQELVRKIARQLGILMARHDHEEEMGKRSSAANRILK